MENEKIRVRISASFEQGVALFEWIRKYAKHSDEHFVYWGEFAFTVEPLPECDAILVFNNPSSRIETLCYPENVLAFMMEPGVASEHPWMFKNLEQYAAVYSPVLHSGNTVLSHGYLGWYLQQDHSYLSALPVPKKQFNISCIASDLSLLKGHQLRLGFINKLRKEFPQIDFFGKGTNYIPEKIEGLLPYRFSVAIENSSAPYYFTEKINDCFLAYTVPVYYGCKNIGKYFPGNSFIQIDIEDPINTMETIRQLSEDDWHQRIGSLQEARELVLNKYQPLAGAADIIRRLQPTVKKTVVLNPVPDRLLRKIKGLLRNLGAKK